MELNELMRKHLQNREELARVVTVTDGVITINVAYEYHISLDRCRDFGEILGWVVQLSEKSWITTDILRYFIKVACTQNDLKIPNA